jgi:hypothetical protein
MNPRLTITEGSLRDYARRRKERRMEAMANLVTRRAPIGALALLALVGCSEPAPLPADLGVSVDATAPGLTLSDGAGTTPMSAYYSFWLEPLENGARIDVYLLLTLVEAGWQCGDSAAGVDSLAFLFTERLSGISSTTVAGRSGPRLGPTSGGGGSAEIDQDQDRLSGWDLDAGTITTGAGGSVAGRVHFAVDRYVLDGSFTAPHCAALDFIASP